MATEFTDLFVFDLDGTLVHSHESGRGIPPALLEALETISSRAHIAVATGRRYRAARPDILAMPHMPYVVLNNGLLIKDHAAQTVHRQLMDAKAALEISNLLDAHGVDHFFVCDGTEQDIDFLLRPSSLDRSDMLKGLKDRVGPYVWELQSLDDLANHHILEVASLGDLTQLKGIQSRFKSSWPDPYRAIVVGNIGVEGRAALEVCPTHISKASGAQWIQNKLGARRVIAIGDDENDIEMLSWAHVSVAMNHASFHVRQAAHQSVDGPEGLARYLMEFYETR